MLCGSCSNLQDAHLPVALPSQSHPDQPPMGVRPMNYVWLTRKLVSGTFMIDPTLKVPSSLIPSHGETQWNLFLNSGSTADVEIYLVDGESQQSQQSQLETQTPQTLISVQSITFATVKLVRSLGVKPSCKMNLICMVQHAQGLAAGGRAPYRLEISAGFAAKVHIPRDFRGSLSLSMVKVNSVHLSDELSRNTTAFRDFGTEMKFFVGDLTESDGEGKSDDIIVRIRNRPVYGRYSIMVGYLDEIIEQAALCNCCCLQ